MLAFVSCSHLRGPDDLTQKEIPEVLKAIKIQGEGRGRLTYGNSQNVFGFDAILRPDSDWLLAVTIPLHGEEVLLMPQLKREHAAGEVQAFEARIARALRELRAPVSPKEFLASLRSHLRFLLNQEINSPVQCVRDEEIICRQNKETYLLEIKKNEISIVQREKKNYQLIVKARNLTDSFFQQTEFFLLTPDGKQQFLALELFWK